MKDSASDLRERGVAGGRQRELAARGATPQRSQSHPPPGKAAPGDPHTVRQVLLGRGGSQPAEPACWGPARSALGWTRRAERAARGSRLSRRSRGRALKKGSLQPPRLPGKIRGAERVAAPSPPFPGLAGGNLASSRPFRAQATSPRAPYAFPGGCSCPRPAPVCSDFAGVRRSGRTQGSAWKTCKDGCGDQSLRKEQPRVCVVFLWICRWSCQRSPDCASLPGAAGQPALSAKPAGSGAPVPERGCRAGGFFRLLRSQGRGSRAPVTRPATLRNRKRRGCSAGFGGQGRSWGPARLGCWAFRSALCRAERRCKWDFTERGRGRETRMAASCTPPIGD